MSEQTKDVPPTEIINEASTAIETMAAKFGNEKLTLGDFDEISNEAFEWLVENEFVTRTDGVAVDEMTLDVYDSVEVDYGPRFAEEMNAIVLRQEVSSAWQLPERIFAAPDAEELLDRLTPPPAIEDAVLQFLITLCQRYAEGVTRAPFHRVGLCYPTAQIAAQWLAVSGIIVHENPGGDRNEVPFGEPTEFVQLAAGFFELLSPAQECDERAAEDTCLIRPDGVPSFTGAVAFYEFLWRNGIRSVHNATASKIQPLLEQWLQSEDGQARVGSGERLRYKHDRPANAKSAARTFKHQLRKFDS